MSTPHRAAGADPVPHCLVVLDSAASGCPRVERHRGKGEALAAGKAAARALVPGEGGWVALYDGREPLGDALRRWEAPSLRGRRKPPVNVTPDPGLHASARRLPGYPGDTAAFEAGLRALHIGAGVEAPKVAPRVRAPGWRSAG